MNNDMRALAGRLINLRANIIKELPFFGRLLMRLQFGFADCETAFTDQKRIVFDPEFLKRLSDEEVKFVMLHELYHCVLNHVGRGKGKINAIYNIACDLVVNSIIFNELCLDEMRIDGTEVMHLAPNGKEARDYDADKLYQELLKLSKERLEKLGDAMVDNHLVWAELDAEDVEKSKAVWRSNLLAAAKECSAGGVPLGLKRYVGALNHNAKLNWKQILHDYIQHDMYDYTFSVPDKRFSSSEFILPSFQEDLEGSKVKKLWVAVDTSGSISSEMLNIALNEIYGALNQVNLSGWISFFDFDITKPVPFESADELDDVKPIGGGGTSFDVIFNSIDSYFEENPEIIVVITDGYAEFPEEESAKGIPVVWCIINSDIKPPWGKAVYIR